MVKVLNLVVLSFFVELISHVSSHGNLDVRDVNHMKEHLPGTMDANKLTNDEMLFHYFRSHDMEGNNKLDGCELLQSLLHFHSEASASYGAQARIFSDIELSTLVDAVLDSDDRNMDGFIDYGEFLAGQISKGL